MQKINKLLIVPLRGKFETKMVPLFIKRKSYFLLISLLMEASVLGTT
jgi:hypothetical protein